MYGGPDLSCACGCDAQMEILAVCPCNPCVGWYREPLAGRRVAVFNVKGTIRVRCPIFSNVALPDFATRIQLAQNRKCVAAQVVCSDPLRHWCPLLGSLGCTMMPLSSSAVPLSRQVARHAWVTSSCSCVLLLFRIDFRFLDLKSVVRRCGGNGGKRAPRRLPFPPVLPSSRIVNPERSGRQARDALR